jgi:hypothetical protein
MPTPQRSTAVEAFAPWSVSGAQQPGVPTSPPSAVRRVAFSPVTRPKSISVTRSAGPSITFEDLMSRCRRPFSWTYASASSTERATSIAWSTSSGPSSRSTVESGLAPSRYSIANHHWSPSRPASRISMITGCASLVHALISRSKRRCASSRLSMSGCRVLIATMRPELLCRARCTRPIPPRPSSSSSSYSIVTPPAPARASPRACSRPGRRAPLRAASRAGAPSPSRAGCRRR